MKRVPCVFYSHDTFAHATYISYGRLTDATNDPSILVTNTLRFTSHSSHNPMQLSSGSLFHSVIQEPKFFPF